MIFASYLLLASVYLLYLPDVQFVLDDWWLFQHFARAHSSGEMVRALLQNTLWGSYRTNGLSFVAIYGLSGLLGPRPRLYFVLGIVLHALIAYLLYRTLARVRLDRRIAFAAGALFVLLPTAHNPLFWFPSCAHYLFSAFWFLIYLHSVAGTVSEGGLRAGAMALQVIALTLALFSGDQVFGLLLAATIALAVCFRSRVALASTALSWATVFFMQALYVRFVNRAPVSGSLAAKFDFSLQRLLDNSNRIWTDYRKLAGSGEDYYNPALIGWGLLIAAALGFFILWRVRQAPEKTGSPVWRGLVLGLLLCGAAYAPALFLRWRELRYDYLPTLGLAVILAAACSTLGRWMPAATAILAAWSAATVVAEIRQCWQPQSRNLQAIQHELRSLPRVRDHDIVAVSNTPIQIGTAPHFAMYLSYSSTPFVETVTGVFGLIVGRDIVYDSGRLGLDHVDFFREIKPEDLRRAYVVACPEIARCVTSVLAAREIGPDRYELLPLKNYSGVPLAPGAVYSREQLRSRAEQVYFLKNR